MYNLDMTSDNTENSSSSSSPGAPYLSFKTFRSGVQSLRANALPTHIDRSVWPSKSGADQTTLLAAFRFLGLIDANNAVRPRLQELVAAKEDTDTEKEVLCGILREHYADLFALNLETITPSQFAEAIGEYGPNRTTRDRARRFFLKAAAHCGVKMSSLLTARKPRGTGAKANGASSQRKQVRKPEHKTPDPPQDVQRSSAMKVIKLPGAQGELMLSGTFNPFELVDSERELVFSIIDSMKAFESKTGEDQ